MPKSFFASYRLRSNWGLSSENVIFSKDLYTKATEENAGIFIMPTLSLTDPLEKNKIFFRIKLVEYNSDRTYIAVSRPLSTIPKDVFSLSEEIKRIGNIPVFASISGGPLSEWILLLEKVDKKFDGIELDLSTSYILQSMKRGFEHFALDIVEELISIASKPVIAKVSINLPLNTDFLEKLVSAGVNGLVFSSHPIYTIGKHVFRVHSTVFSRVILRIVASLATQIPEISLAYISDEVLGKRDDLLDIFNVVLYDTSYIFSKISISRYSPQISSSLPIRWDEVPKGMKIALDTLKGDICRNICPYGAFRPEYDGGFTEAEEICDYCGLCFSICKDSVKFVKSLKPD